ncbi:MAG: ribonuclease H-like domain-containing protein [Spirochaetes bacterium]|nr:ribonuclease H-like domain-containing protein [Spirochaetota bacterium]
MSLLQEKLNLYKKKSHPDESSKITPEHFGAEKLMWGTVPLWRFKSIYNIKEDIKRLSLNYSHLPEFFFKSIGFQDAVSLKDVVFVDLETTSLSIGAGSYAFLFGFGALQDEVLTVEQYFMHEYSEEPAILRAILPLFQEKIAVTYNGFSFDIPLLKNRYRINRIAGFPLDKKHIDLLYPSRVVFKSLFENCALITLESRVLGIDRIDDIPSWLIPEIYFSYQKNGEIDRMRNVIAHHKQDIISMAILMLFLINLYHNLEHRRFDAMSNVAFAHIARWLYRRDLELFLDVVNFMGESVLSDRMLFKMYSCAMKRIGRHDEIMKFWRKDASVYSKEELAKYYEHIAKDYREALAHCAQAMSFLNAGLFAEGVKFSHPEAVTFYRERFEKRIQRLLRKIDPHLSLKSDTVD